MRPQAERLYNLVRRYRNPYPRIGVSSFDGNSGSNRERDPRGVNAGALPDLDEKPASEDFASALENFTAETEEAASDDKVIKGTVLKLTPTHVVVDIGTKSEGMLPIAEVRDHEGNVKFKPGEEIES